MGCDIHLYMEYGKKGSWDGDKIWVNRSYGLFTTLAGVRRYTSTVESFELRGVPENVSGRTLDDYTLYISDEKGEGYCTQEDAERYVQYGSAFWGSDRKKVIHPDWHSASWLSLSEFKVAYKRFLDYYKQDKSEPVNPIPEVEGIIGFLEAMMKHGYETRIVFWFDN